MWLMDDDCIVYNDSLTKLILANNKLSENYGFLASKVLWKDKTICKMNIQKKSLTKKNDDWDNETVRIIMSSFVSFFIKTSVVEEVGLPIKEFFIWADDLEYSRRISKKYPCYLINQSIVMHKSKNNIGSNIAIDSNENLKRYSFSYRNEMYLYRNEGLKGRLYYLLKRYYHKYRIFSSKSSNKKERYAIINDAVKQGRIFYPKVEYFNGEQND